RASRCRWTWWTSAAVRARPTVASPSAAAPARRGARTPRRWTRSRPRSSSSAGSPSTATPIPERPPAMTDQLRDGRLHHLLTLEGLPRPLLERLLERADALRPDALHGRAARGMLAGRTVVNLFFEPSTRTRTSFELAARRLGADVVNFDAGLSSTRKGETL